MQVKYKSPCVRLLILYLILLILGLTSCGKKQPEVEKMLEREEILEIKEENVSVVIPELKNEYKFLVVVDLHIILENEEIKADHLMTVKEREKLFKTADGVTSAKLWEKLPEVLNHYKADAVLLGGDMIDYSSTSNIEHLREGIERLDVPTMYVRADHDYGTWYSDLNVDYVNGLHKKIDENEEVFLLEFSDLCIVGINNNTSQISHDALTRFKKIISLGKPIILLMHVPLMSQVDYSLNEQSKKVWQDRALVWGDGCSYEPDANTQEFLNMVYAKNSQVREIFSGHLHFSWDGELTSNTRQHVFAPAFSGSIGIIKVSNGEND